MAYRGGHDGRNKVWDDVEKIKNGGEAIMIMIYVVCIFSLGSILCSPWLKPSKPASWQHTNLLIRGEYYGNKSHINDRYTALRRHSFKSVIAATIDPSYVFNTGPAGDHHSGINRDLSISECAKTDSLNRLHCGRCQRLPVGYTTPKESHCKCP